MGKKRFPCGYCGKDFTAVNARNDHQAVCTVGMDDRPGMRQRPDGTNFRPGN